MTNGRGGLILHLLNNRFSSEMSTQIVAQNYAKSSVCYLEVIDSLESLQSCMLKDWW